MAHADYFSALAKRANELYKQGHDAVWQGLALFDQERAQIEAAFAWLSGDSRHDARLITLVQGVSYTSNLRFYPRQRIVWLDAQLNSARRLGSRGTEGAALANLGLAWADLGETHKAMEYFEQDLTITLEIGDRLSEGYAYNNLGNAWADLGETHKAINYYGQSLL